MPSELRKDILAAIFEGIPIEDTPGSWKSADIPGRQRIKDAYKLINLATFSRKTIKSHLDKKGY